MKNWYELQRQHLLKEVQLKIEHIVNMTPSGEERNRLTDVNITLLDILAGRTDTPETQDEDTDKSDRNPDLDSELEKVKE